MSNITHSIGILILIGIFNYASQLFAERPEETHGKASHVVRGHVTGVFIREGEEEMEYMVRMRIEAIERGTGHQTGESIYVYAYQLKPDAPVKDAANGHNSLPKEGQYIRAWIKGGQGQMKALYPDWFERLNQRDLADSKIKATRKDLDEYLSRFSNEETWVYGERKRGELAGTWISEGSNRHRVRFGSNGSYTEESNGKKSFGMYAISPKGRIVAYSKSDLVPGIGRWFWFNGEMLIGPKGPKPDAHWMREVASK